MTESQIDFRYRWLSETISNLLGIFDRKFADTLIAEHNEQIKYFFNDDINDYADANKQILFVWRTFYDKLVEETISVLEEGNCHNLNLYLNFYFLTKISQIKICFNVN